RSARHGLLGRAPKPSPGEGRLMLGTLATPLHEALIELQLAAGLVLLANQGHQPLGECLERLGRAVASVQESRELADELVRESGRAVLPVLDGLAPPVADVA